MRGENHRRGNGANTGIYSEVGTFLFILLSALKSVMQLLFPTQESTKKKGEEAFHLNTLVSAPKLGGGGRVCLWLMRFDSLMAGRLKFERDGNWRRGVNVYRTK